MLLLNFFSGTVAFAQNIRTGTDNSPRQRISIYDNCFFYQYDSPANAGKLIYDVRLKVEEGLDHKVADARPHMPMPETMDVICLNYQAEGIRNAAACEGAGNDYTSALSRLPRSISQCHQQQ